VTVFPRYRATRALGIPHDPEGYLRVGYGTAECRGQRLHLDGGWPLSKVLVRLGERGFRWPARQVALDRSPQLVDWITCDRTLRGRATRPPQHDHFVRKSALAVRLTARGAIEAPPALEQSAPSQLNPAATWNDGIARESYSLARSS
jgi:hypothetical protein